MTGKSGYWNRSVLSRRAALRGAAVAGGGALALSLAGCGGGSSKSSSSSATPRAAVADSTQGKPGGNFIWGLSGYPAGFDVFTTTNIHTTAGMSYSGLLGHKWGQESVGEFEYYNLEPDLALALPEQPDELTMSFKLRPGVKFHNGKTLTSEDVAYTYNRYATYDKSLYTQKYSSWIDRVETPDPQTVVIKAKFPFADAVVSTAANNDAFISSKEFAEGPDTNNKFMGTGPYVFVSATPPVDIKWRRNPDYYGKPYPYFDEMQAIGYSDPVKRLADFVSGQIQIPWLVYADERDQIKKQRPEAKQQTWDSWAQALFMRTDKPPFNDRRVRQALSMAIDRKKIREVATKGEGRDDQFFALQYKDLFGFREVKDLGPAAKYWEYNPAEVKKLLSAAGIDKPIETSLAHYGSTTIGQFFVDIAIATEAGWKELGVANVKDVDQTSAQYNTTTSRGNYDGLGMGITTGFNNGAPAFTSSLRDRFFWGPSGEHSANNLSYVNDPRLNTLVDKQLRQLKIDDRKATYHEMEPIIAEEQYAIVFSTTTQTYFFDPKLRNARMSIEQGSRRFMMRWWFA